MKTLSELVANCPVLVELQNIKAKREEARKSLQPLKTTLSEIDVGIKEAEEILQAENCSQDKAEKASLSLSGLKARRDVTTRQLAEHPVHAAIKDFDAQEYAIRQRRLGFALRDAMRPHIQERTDKAKEMIIAALELLNGTRGEIDSVMRTNGIRDSWDGWARSVLMVEEGKISERRLSAKGLRPLNSFYHEPNIR